MTVRVVRYTVGNEHDPGDPRGRSELVIQPDGFARLDHHFSHVGGVGAWSGRLEAAALDDLWSELDRAGFPTAPTRPLIPGTSVRRLTVEADRQTRHAMVGWHQSATLPGYAEAFDILDAVANQLSGGAVPYAVSWHARGPAGALGRGRETSTLSVGGVQCSGQPTVRGDDPH